MENTLNKKIEGMQSEMTQKFSNLQYLISRLTNQQQVHEKGKFPSQTQPNPKGVHEVASSSEPTPKMDEVKAVITMRSGKQVEQPAPTPAEETKEKKEENPERIVIKEDTVKKSTPPPFPQALKCPLLDMIKQVPTYDKFLKDLCTIKTGLNIDKKAFLTEQVSAIIQCKTPVKYKDPGCPTISVNIGGTSVEKALLDLGASVNLLLYSIYKKLGLGEFKPTTITLSLTDRSVNIPKGTIEDVLVQVDKFYYLVDFVVLDTKSVALGPHYVSIILGRPFLATSNAIINCQNGVMQLTFENMTLELNIFHLSKNHMPLVEEDQEQVCQIDAILGEQY